MNLFFSEMFLICSHLSYSVLYNKGLLLYFLSTFFTHRK